MVRCGDPSHRGGDPEDEGHEAAADTTVATTTAMQGMQDGIDDKTQLRTHKLVFGVTPVLCVALTIVMAVVPGSATVGQGIVCLFTYGFLPSLGQDGGAGKQSVLYYGNDITPERNVVTVAMFLYIPVLYLWKATGRLAKAYPGSDCQIEAAPEVKGSWTVYLVPPLWVLQLGRLVFPWRRQGVNSGGHKGRIAARLHHRRLIHYLSVYVRHVWSLNQYLWAYQSHYWRHLMRNTQLKGRGWVPKRMKLHSMTLTKLWWGRACTKAQEARRGGEKDWKKLKKAWALKSWVDLQHRDVLLTYNNRVSLSCVSLNKYMHAI